MPVCDLVSAHHWIVLLVLCIKFCLWTMHTIIILNPWYMYNHWIYTTSTMCNLVHVYLALGSAVSRWGTAIGWRQGFYTLPKTSATFPWYTIHLLSREPTANEAYLIRLCWFIFFSLSLKATDLSTDISFQGPGHRFPLVQKFWGPLTPGSREKNTGRKHTSITKCGHYV